VYGFGAILYETFTGHRPFEGLDGIPLLNQIATAAPVPMTSFRPGLDPAIVALVERAMAQDPDQRFRSVEMLIGAIESLLPPTSMLRALTPVVGVPIIPNVVPVRPPSAHPAPRHSRVPWIMAGVATALAIGLACWIAVH
jgi:serine/threonine-protein kinase